MSDFGRRVLVVAAGGVALGVARERTVRAPDGVALPAGRWSAPSDERGGGLARRWERLLAVVVSVGLVLVLAGRSGVAGGGPVPGSVAAQRQAGLGVVSGLGLQAQSVISSALGAGDPRFLPRPAAGGFELGGGGVGLRAGRRGVSVSGAGGRLWLGLAGAGSVSPAVSAGRVVYARGDGVVEWYRAGALGVEQGFVLRHRPAGRSRELSLAMRLGGGLQARISRGEVLFAGRSGRVALRYGGLVATDASGRQLPASLSLSGSRLLLRVADRGARFPVRIDPFIAQGPKLTASDETGPALFGSSVAVSANGNTALIGGMEDNPAAGFAGAVWVFVRSQGAWSQQGPKLTAAGSGVFGDSVALSADGNTALIGAGGTGAAGAAWVFTRSGSTWTQQAELTPDDAVATPGLGVAFGSSVALSADGNTALIGGPYDFNGRTDEGAAWVFTRSGSSWTQQGSKLAPPPAGSGRNASVQFGFSVALSADGNTALIGGYEDNEWAGAAWVFTRSGGVWSQQGSKLVGTGAGATANAAQGFSVALSADGNTALIGGPGDAPFAPAGPGAAWVFTRSAGVWSQQGPELTADDESGAGVFGGSVALSGDGNAALIGGPGDGGGSGTPGAAWEFSRSGGVWTQQGSKLTGAGELPVGLFGISVALSSDGGTALIGGYGDNGPVSPQGPQFAPGAAWVFVDRVAITSPPAATFTTGQAGSVTVTTSGHPAAAVTESGALPAGISLVNNDNGTATLSGTPDPGAGGVYDVTITASNGVAPAASQSFVLTVDQPPAFTSTAHATFTVGQPQSFTIATTAFPAAALSVSGTLPAGISFTPGANGTATLSGTPAAGTGGTYPLRITAANGITPDAIQNLLLVAQAPPAVVIQAPPSVLIQAPPSVVIGNPVSGARFTRTAPVRASYSCQDGAGGPGIISCTGTVANGDPLDTATAGRHTLTVTATSSDGQVTTSTVTYTVRLPDNHFTVSHIKIQADGTITFQARVPGSGTIDVLETAWNDNLVHTAVMLHAAARRFPSGRAHTNATHTGVVNLKVGLNATGKRLVHHHTYPVTLRLWVSYTPTGGVYRSIGFYGLHLPRRARI
jgi:hypothetical protein